MNYCTVNERGQIEQIARGFSKCPFENGIEISDEISLFSENYLWVEGMWIYHEVNRRIKSVFDPIDPEKVALAEGIIDLATEMGNLNTRLTILEEGGV